MEGLNNNQEASVKLIHWCCWWGQMVQEARNSARLDVARDARTEHRGTQDLGQDQKTVFGGNRNPWSVR